MFGRTGWPFPNTVTNSLFLTRGYAKHSDREGVDTRNLEGARFLNDISGRPIVIVGSCVAVNSVISNSQLQTTGICTFFFCFCFVFFIPKVKKDFNAHSMSEIDQLCSSKRND